MLLSVCSVGYNVAVLGSSASEAAASSSFCRRQRLRSYGLRSRHSLVCLICATSFSGFIRDPSFSLAAFKQFGSAAQDFVQWRTSTGGAKYVVFSANEGSVTSFAPLP
jgi:hypothetical protein